MTNKFCHDKITTVNKKVYVNLIRRCEYSRKAIIFGRIKNYVRSSSSERDQITHKNRDWISLDFWKENKLCKIIDRRRSPKWKFIVDKEEISYLKFWKTKNYVKQNMKKSEVMLWTTTTTILTIWMTFSTNLWDAWVATTANTGATWLMVERSHRKSLLSTGLLASSLVKEQVSRLDKLLLMDLSKMVS